MSQLISVVIIFALLLGGCAMSATPTSSDVNRDPSRAQDRLPETGGGGGY
jgi:PBP1b-binding outer membrane lipoprotein LpoB